MKRLKRNQENNQVWHRLILYGVLGLYIIILLILLFGKASSMRTINLVPFHTIADYLSHDKPLGISNVIGNVVLFIPMGVYLALFRPNKKQMGSLLYILLASAAIEVTQYILQVGAADIDDVILNGIGGLLGIALYQFLKRIFKQKVRHAVEIISLITGILFLIVAVGLWTGIFDVYIRIL